MKRTIPVLVLVLLGFVLLFGCKKSDNPAAPVATDTPVAINTPTATGTPTATVNETQTVIALSRTPTNTLTITETITPSITQTITATVTTTSTPNILSVTGTTVLDAGTYNYDFVHIYSGGILQLKGSGGAATGAHVTINCTQDFIVDAGGTVQGSGAGYATFSGPGAPTDSASGAGHGGAGGISGTGGPANDSATNPAYMGSSSYFLTGGAFLKVTAGNNAAINGDIYMNGNGGAVGAGAGGTIYIVADSISGNGSMQANGGNSVSGGGGGGGIIVLSSHSGNTYSGATSAAGGSATYPGGTGIVTVQTY